MRAEPGHRTAGEKAAAAAGQAAVERARAHTAPAFDPDADQEATGVSGHITPTVARLIREQIERSRRG